MLEGERAKAPYVRREGALTLNCYARSLLPRLRATTGSTVHKVGNIGVDVGGGGFGLAGFGGGCNVIGLGVIVRAGLHRAQVLVKGAQLLDERQTVSSGELLERFSEWRGPEEKTDVLVHVTGQGQCIGQFDVVAVFLDRSLRVGGLVEEADNLPDCLALQIRQLWPIVFSVS